MDRQCPLMAAKHLAIAQLSPLLIAPSSRYVHGVVALIWPYSSLPPGLALLLSEPDFRLRRNRGQVRVHLLGSSAQGLADKNLAIGDVVDLSLEGVEWIRHEEGPISTPGKDVDLELQFSSRLIMKACLLYSRGFSPTPVSGTHSSSLDYQFRDWRNFAR